MAAIIRNGIMEPAAAITVIMDRAAMAAAMEAIIDAHRMNGRHGAAAGAMGTE